MKAGNVQKAALLLAAALCLAGCEGAEAETPRRIYVGVTYYNQSDTFMNALLECFREKTRALEVENDDLEIVVTAKGAGGSQRTQNDQVTEMVDAGCDVLCVNLVDRTDPSDIIDLARENEIPIIFFNREPVAEDLSQWEKLYYVGADAQQSGILQGELAAEWIREHPEADRNGDGKIQYVVLEGEPGHQDAIIRTENAVETLKGEGIELEKLGYGIANWNRAQAQNRMTQMIDQSQTKIELVLANNDDMALGALDACRSLNYADTDLPVFFGIDGTDVGLAAVADGSLAGTVYNDKERQAEAMARLAVEAVTGDAVPEEERCLYFPYIKISADEIDKWLSR